jgi:hypothetical protein
MYFMATKDPQNYPARQAAEIFAWMEEQFSNAGDR